MSLRIHRRDFHLPGLDLGQIENVVEQGSQRLARTQDDIQLVALVRPQRFHGKGLRHAEHAVEGVRISWLIVARKSDLALEAALAFSVSAASRAGEARKVPVALLRHGDGRAKQFEGAGKAGIIAIRHRP